MAVPLKDKRGITITNDFQKILHSQMKKKIGWIKWVNFIIEECSHGGRIII